MNILFTFGVNEQNVATIRPDENGQPNIHVDGITSVSILWHLIKILGGNVEYYIPHRVDEGYGLNEDAIRQLADNGIDLIITVDCGITAVKEAALANELGVDIIITDHHQPGPELPQSVAIVHPSIDTSYANPDSAGAMVAFKLAWAIVNLNKTTAQTPPQLREFLLNATTLAAMGTIADVVNLRNENRILTSFGLKSLAQTQMPGLKALMESAELSGDLDSYHIAFKLAPMLNAAGRMGHARLAVDLLTSGIFAAHFINTVSPTFLTEVVEGHHDFVPTHVRAELAHKFASGCASGILNAPDASFGPRIDRRLQHHYGPEDHGEAKRRHKCEFQHAAGLEVDPDAPLFLWPSRLDPVQKGCQLLAHILYDIVHEYWDAGLQVAFVSNGPYQDVFWNIVEQHQLAGRVALCDFSEQISREGYAAADYVLMPSRFEPCGLPQMIGPLYGTLPIAHDTGGLHDTVIPLDPVAGTGNGFRFETYDPGGLRWAIDEAMGFFRAPAEVRQREIARVMTESTLRFHHAVTARAYIDLYEQMLHRPLVKST